MIDASGMRLRRPVPLFRRGTWYESYDTRPQAELVTAPHVGLAPALLVREDVRWFRRHSRDFAAPGTAERRQRLERAIDLFVHGTVDLGPAGLQSAASFAELMEACTGLPAPLVRRWSRALRVGGARESCAPRIADDLAVVSLPANTFVCCQSVIELALAGASVWIRPSRREPFSAWRLVAALVAAGWPAERLGLYSTTPEVLELLVELADYSVLYGGDDVARRFGGSDRCRVNGPGRARAIVAGDVDPVRAAAWLLPRVAADAGRFCTLLGTILVLGSPDEVGRRLAALLDAVPVGPSEPDPPFPLAAWPDEAAALETERWLAARLAPGDRMLTRRALLQRRADGRAVLVPGLLQLAEPERHPLLGVELSFPFAVIARATRERLPRLVGTTAFVSTFPECEGLLPSRP